MITLKNILTYRRINIAQWYDILQIALLGVLFVLLPSVSSNELMQGTVSGKMFFFLYAILIYCILYFVKFIVKLPSSLSITYLDGILVLWVVYILFNSCLHSIQFSDRLLEFGGLVLLYIFLRQIDFSKYRIIFAGMILGVIIQAVYGNLQLWGFAPSHHALFKITGSFFNPGPYSGYLATVFPVIVGGLLFKKKFLPFVDAKWNQIFVWVGFVFILLALSASDSRAAWLSVFISSLLLLMKRYSVNRWIKNLTLIKRVVLLVSVIFLVGGSFWGLFQMNTNSANGRLLVWKVASDMVVKQPFFGVGYNRFKAYYMDEQANYFKENPDSPEAMVAGDTNYCFNELLQHTVENGVIGLVFMVGVLVYIFCLSNKYYDNELWIAKAGIAGIVVFALFSYPAQVLPIKICLICYLAYTAILSEKKFNRHLPMNRYFFKTVFAVLAIGFVFIAYNLSSYQMAWKKWNLANQLAQSKNYSASINEGKSAWFWLRNNGDFLTFYGKSLTMAGEYNQAIEVLSQAVLLYPNTVVYTALGDNYKNLGQKWEAEQAYFKAWYMNPSRFYPKYLLAKLYDETGQDEKAIATAEELLGKEIKIESTAISEIQTEMKSILERNKERR